MSGTDLNTEQVIIERARREARREYSRAYYANKVKTNPLRMEYRRAKARRNREEQKMRDNNSP